jgi:hypothetical protein
MQDVFISEAGLNDLIEILQTELINTNWLFVVLDSARGDLLSVREFLTPKLEKEGVNFWWGQEGLWIAGQELTKDFMASKVIVAFTAAFVFDSHVKCSAKPQFDDTTDQGEFIGSQLKAASREIERLKAKAYVADGCGLQCVFADSVLFRLVSAYNRIWKGRVCRMRSTDTFGK